MQPILWSRDYHVGATEATVHQERNPHNLLKDFESEIPCYLHAQKAVDVVRSAVRQGASVSENLFLAYQALCKEKIVEKKKLGFMECWLKDLNKIMSL